jgi:hypothetical protein
MSRFKAPFKTIQIILSSRRLGPPTHCRKYESLKRRKYHYKMDGEETRSRAASLSTQRIEAIAILTRMTKELNAISATGTFEYDRTLPPNWIRFVDIQNGSHTDLLICALSTAPFTVPMEPFEAVSYVVWGYQAQPRKITCNWLIPFIEDGEFLVAYPTKVTENFSVTNNLYQLLL